MIQYKLNLACGDVCVVGDCWLDFSYAISGPTSRAADLLAKLPIASKGLAAEQLHVITQLIQCAQVSAAMLLHGGRHG
jgi:hypothetical protein